MTDLAHIILYDSVCNLCNGLVRFISARYSKGEILFFPLLSAEAQSMLKQYRLSANDTDTIVYIKPGKYYMRSSAILHIAKELGGFWKIFFIFILVPRFIRDYIYTLFAKSRYRITGRQNSCENLL